MRSRVRAGLSFANVTALAALVLAMAGGAYAVTGAGTAATLHGCVSRRTGALRIIGSGRPCHRRRRQHGRVIDPGEYAIAFNVQGPPGVPGTPGPAGPAGTPGAAGAPGTVDTSQFFTKAQADARYLGIGAVTYGQAAMTGSGDVVASWPALGFAIVTAGPTSVGNIALAVTDTGSQNINGTAMVHNGNPNNTISAFPFGLNPGQTSSPAFSTGGPFIDFAVVPSGSDPALAADVRCLNITSGGVTRVHCWTLRSG